MDKEEADETDVVFFFERLDLSANRLSLDALFRAENIANEPIDGPCWLPAESADEIAPAGSRGGPECVTGDFFFFFLFFCGNKWKVRGKKGKDRMPTMAYSAERKTLNGCIIYSSLKP